MANEIDFPVVGRATGLANVGAPSPPAPGIQSQSLSEQALTLIRQAMVAGDMLPGEIYSASALAQRLKVSNSPVREAMLKLVSEGLMEAVRNRGFRVVPIAEHDLRDIFDIRLMLEVPAICRLAERGSIDDIRRYRKLADEIVEAAEAKDITRYLLADRDLHLGLIGQLGNSRLVAMVENLRDQTRLFGLHALAESDRLVGSAQEHHKLLDAIVDSDVELTRVMMTNHLQHILYEWSGRARPE
jgi:DNA-binding GntR family transcriptional regulator